VTPSEGNGSQRGPSKWIPRCPSPLANGAHRVYAENYRPCDDSVKHEMCTNIHADHNAASDIFKFVRKPQIGVFPGVACEERSGESIGD
jgi:hypothetical protein